MAARGLCPRQPPERVHRSPKGPSRVRPGTPVAPTPYPRSGDRPPPPQPPQDQEFTYGPFLPLLGTGLVTSEGEEWRRQRALVSGVFRIEVPTGRGGGSFTSWRAWVR